VYLKSQPNVKKPFLVTEIIEPKLEDIFVKNKALTQHYNNFQWTSWLRNCVDFLYSMFRYKLTPKTLRKPPRLKAVSGLDRLEKL